ncbi:YcxB family protein [Agrobacterium larrymoorei]|uniref:YcxB family protein n=1 Tax=Agrobacterium larrymoorei TaxID=160699 RepID=A0AAF0KD20_9HYPH|nr:YcxB family protein [Agrobacterium larrymoorei]WHA40438.1 YcxB family protein [Agrobacterium larrymoorei]
MVEMHEIRYIFERRDFVALTRALVRRPFWTTALKFIFASLIAGHVFVVQLMLSTGKRISADYLDFYFKSLPLWFLPLVFTACGDHLAGLLAAYVFKKNASANKEIIIDLQDDVIRARSDDIKSEIGWKSIVRVIETDKYLFLALSKREALTLPKRAFPSDAALADTMQFVREHVSPQTPVVRHSRFRTIDLRAA